VGGDDDLAAIGGQTPAQRRQLEQRLGLVAAHAAEVEDELARPADRGMGRQVVDLAGSRELPAGVDDDGALAESPHGGDFRRGDRQGHVRRVPEIRSRRPLQGPDP
jgi:hypothetical protein